MAEIRKVLVLGAKGTLGGQLMRLYPEATGWDREELDVLDAAALGARLDGLGSVPLAVVNCVAFNDVDGAEDRPEQAFALNAEFPGWLARWTKEKGVPLVHYSTNYVFDGVRGEYRESDAPAPLSAYARSKWRGEQLVAENGGQWYVVRTAVIFGPKGESELSKKSFVDIMLDLAAKRDTIEAGAGAALEVVRGAHRRDFRAQGRERAVEEELRRHHAGPGGEARYHRGGGRRGQQRDVRAGPGGGHARPAGGSPARGHLSRDQPRRRELGRFRARDLSHRGEEHDGAAGALDALSAQGEAPGAGGPAEYPTAAAAPVAGRAGGLPHAGWLTLSGKRSVKWVRGLGRLEALRARRVARRASCAGKRGTVRVARSLPGSPA